MRVHVRVSLSCDQLNEFSLRRDHFISWHLITAGSRRAPADPL